jgi:glutathione S-transferase
MQLIGMLDSPYVRRVAISLQLLNIPFEHQSLSVFRTYGQFQKINPVVKAPTLVCDNGGTLMDSSLIIDYAEALAAGRVTLMPVSISERQQALHIIGLALAACEKSVQIVYERMTRPEEKWHQPWVSRVTEQMLAAYGELETAFQRQPRTVDNIDQAGLTTAVVWHFTRQMLPELLNPAHYPALQAYSTQAEALPEFQAVPHGESTYQT